jgi:plasmid stabilization system protein ParE
MKEGSWRIRFSNLANDDIDSVAHYIKDDSPKNYQRIREAVFFAIEKLEENPHRHPPDRFKRDNTGNYRAFEKHNYRVTYKVMEDTTLILRIRHARQMPLDY